MNILWGSKVSTEFLDKLHKICTELGCDINHMMSAMAFETAETFSPSIKNVHSGAIGLIQFTSTTAKGIGTTVSKLAHMSAVEQLDYVHRYFKPFRGRLHSLSDLYMAILWPAAVGKGPTFALFDSRTKRRMLAYKQNAGLDIDHNGVVTKVEATIHVTKKMYKGAQFSVEYSPLRPGGA